MPETPDISPSATTAIAVVGMAARFPGADTIDSFWKNLCEGRESVTFGTGPRRENHVNASAPIEGADRFDARFFGMSGRDAALTDPQHRVFLELAWHALEHAGCDPERFGGPIGVFAGAGRNGYFAHNLAGHPDIANELDRYRTVIASEHDYLATRTAFKLNLRGPAITVQTACSTSLVAVHLACRSLLDGECSMALAGAVSVRVPFDEGHPVREDSMYSPDGHTRPFDRDACGTLFGSGAGILVLMPLETALDAGHTVHAVIRGTALNNDGAGKDSFTAPSASGQAEVIREALRRAGTAPSEIRFIEAHGTGTRVGDPIELGALGEVFGQRDDTLLVGSVKGNIAHADAAAGMAGLIKSILSLKHGCLPATINCPNPVTADSRIGIATELTELKRGAAPIRAGVTSLGFGGTNAHAVLEEAPDQAASGPETEWQVLVLSAPDADSLEQLSSNLAKHLRLHPRTRLADVAWTLQTGRKRFPHRKAVICRSVAETADILEGKTAGGSFTSVAPEKARRIAFTFPGHGSHHVGMARDLYETEPVFRAAVDECCDALAPDLGFDLRPAIFPSGDDTEARAMMKRTDYVQSSLFVISYAYATLWKSWGVRPDAVIGYSIGELSAACVTGMLGLAEAARLVATRASLIHTTPPGAMLAVGLDEHELAPFMVDGIDIGAISAPRHTILSGPHPAMDEVEAKLRDAGIGHRRIEVPHAFHSRMLEPVSGAYLEALGKVDFGAPDCEFVSTVDGCRKSAEALADPVYWQREMIEPVRYSDAVATLAAEPDWTFLEVGPSRLLSALTRGHPAVESQHVVLSSGPNERDGTNDAGFILTTAARLWVEGHGIDWSAVHRNVRRTLIPLPGHPFRRERHWIEAPKVRPASPKLSLKEWTDEPQESGAPTRPAETATLPDAAVESVESAVSALWCELLDCRPPAARDSFLDLGGNSLTAVQLLARVRERFGLTVPLRHFLEAPTLESLCGLIDAGSIEDESDDESLLALLDEIEAMSPDEVCAGLEAVPPAPPRPEAPNRDSGPELSLMFFAADADQSSDPYELVTEASVFADRNGLSSVWMPERHFHRFGGLYPNPAVLGAAIAARTERIGIRAGSLITPLHDPLRVVEDWSMIDRISGGRVGIAFAAGFHPRDFALAPDRFDSRHDLTWRAVEEVRHLWSHGSATRTDGVGASFEARPYPRPLQQALPTWITATRSIDTFRQAGRIGANVLTAMIRISREELRERIAAYRETLAEHGHDPSAGCVTLMLHTYVGGSDREVRQIAEPALLQYLMAHLNFMNSTGQPLGKREADALLADAFERYWSSASLIGTSESCARRLRDMAETGVDEVACLIDFGIERAEAMAGLERLASINSPALQPIP